MTPQFDLEGLDITIAAPRKSFAWSNGVLVGCVATFLTVLVASSSVALVLNANANTVSLMQTMTTARSTIGGVGVRSAKQAPVAAPVSQRVRAGQAPSSGRAETVTAAAAVQEHSMGSVQNEEFAEIPQYYQSAESVHQPSKAGLYFGIAAFAGSAAAAVAALIQNNSSPQAHVRIAMMNTKVKPGGAVKGGAAKGGQGALGVGYKGSTQVGSAPNTKTGKPGFVYKLGTKNGRGNVDEYSPIWEPDTFKTGGETYELGVTGLLIWAAGVVGLLGTGGFLIYYTSNL